MATYPSFHISEASPGVEPIDSLDITRATTGKGIAYEIYSTDKHHITLVHSLITASERSTLDAFYAANRRLTVDVVVDGVTYSCLMKKPRHKLLTGSRSDTTVEFFEV